MQKAAKYHKFKWNLFEPSDPKGEPHLLGIFDTEKPYKHFKTLGAKRYIYQCYDDTFHITIAGVNKDTGAKYMSKLASENNCTEFDIFTDSLYFPKGECGKKELLYKDSEFTDIVTDYLGNEAIVHEKSYIYMCDGDYSLGVSGEFRMLWQKIHNGGI